MMRAVTSTTIMLALAACPASDPKSQQHDAITVPEVASDSAIDTAREPDVEVGPPRRVLFIGNSYTYVNDLPSVVQALAAATPGRAVEVETIAIGGWTLYQHANDATTLARVRSGELDVVILQGQSMEPLGEASLGFDAGAELLGDVADESNVEAIWFATWARRAGHPDYGGYIRDPEWLTWTLETAYARAAARHDDPIARMGSAFLLATRELEDIELFANDGSHPSSIATTRTAATARPPARSERHASRASARARAPAPSPRTAGRSSTTRR